MSPNPLEYSEYLVDYKLFFRDMLTFESPNFKYKLLKSRLKDLDLSSSKSYNSFRKPNNLTTEEFESLLKLTKNENIVTQKSDKDNSVVLIDNVYTNGVY